ncbi:hypothetical protein [Zobellia sp. B3R18]|uniref:hypothetical protein n=1 Tax=Zobellia sp. B3R18 TaxID=2841568 RepID=UPI001C07A65D|nr:hypothetical protein [Zobellia sp. B3R18]MBU2973277.1 hypothetical protein [Zobellia sp. B3R18]
MIFLDPYNPNIIEARELHVKRLLPIVLDRVSVLPNGDLKNYLSKYKVRNILTDLPDKLVHHHHEWLSTVSGISVIEWQDFLVAKGKQSKSRTTAQKALIKKYVPILGQIQSVFKYTNGFARKSSKYSAYNLAEKLNSNTCVYCNRIYTKTVVNPSKITRPEFDHWFPKGTYPILALSFYNLIPSCHVCNSSVKSTTIMDTKKFLHPYIPEQINLKFSYWIESLNKYSFTIKRPIPSKEHNTVVAFKIEDIYKTHRDEINDLVRLRKLYSIDYLLKLKGLLKSVDSNVSMEELYRLAFGTHYEEKNFSKRPLSKMKRDILEELGMILE